VLFAIISIMLFQGMSAGTPVRVDGLSLEQRNDLVAKAGDRLERVDEACLRPPAAGTPCAEPDRRFAVYLRTKPAGEASDLAKQLLVLVGTLMTSVTSYYFAARGMPAAGEPTPAPGAAGNGAGVAGGAAGGAAAGSAAAAAAGPAAAADAAGVSGSASGEGEAPADRRGTDVGDASGAGADDATGAGPVGGAAPSPRG
jgi:hypothetical protein